MFLESLIHLIRMQFHVPSDVAIDKVVKGAYSALASLIDRARLSKFIEETLTFAIIVKVRG